MMNDYTSQIEEIVKWFNFDKALTVMSCLNWKWYLDDGRYVVPDRNEVISTATKLLNEVAYGPFSSVASGGFIAERKNCELSLSFVVENVEALSAENT